MSKMNIIAILAMLPLIIDTFRIYHKNYNLDCKSSGIQCLSNVTFTTCNNADGMTHLANTVIECPEGFFCNDESRAPCELDPNESLEDILSSSPPSDDPEDTIKPEPDNNEPDFDYLTLSSSMTVPTTEVLDVSTSSTKYIPEIQTDFTTTESAKTTELSTATNFPLSTETPTIWEENWIDSDSTTTEIFVSITPEYSLFTKPSTIWKETSKDSTFTEIATSTESSTTTEVPLSIDSTATDITTNTEFFMTTKYPLFIEPSSTLGENFEDATSAEGGATAESSTAINASVSVDPSTTLDNNFLDSTSTELATRMEPSTTTASPSSIDSSKNADSTSTEMYTTVVREYSTTTEVDKTTSFTSGFYSTYKKGSSIEPSTIGDESSEGTTIEAQKPAITTKVPLIDESENIASESITKIGTTEIENLTTMLVSPIEVPMTTEYLVTKTTIGVPTTREGIRDVSITTKPLETTKEDTALLISTTTVSTTTKLIVARPTEVPTCSKSNIGELTPAPACNQYYECVQQKILFIKYYEVELKSCENSYHFSSTLLKCVDPELSDCED